MKIYIHRELHINVFQHFIHNNKNLEPKYQQRKGKQTVLHQYNRRELSNKKETTDICNKDESAKPLC